MSAFTLLVVEDGFEYTDHFELLRRRSAGDWSVVRAGDAEAARLCLGNERVDAVFIDEVFDRTAEDRLAGDPSRGLPERVAHQGFYVLDALAEAIGDRPVVIAHDFSGEEERLAHLRRRTPGLGGLEPGVPLSRVLERFFPR